MSNKEYLKIYKKFMQEDEVFYISEHRRSYENKLEFKNTIKKASRYNIDANIGNSF